VQLASPAPSEPSRLPGTVTPIRTRARSPVPAPLPPPRQTRPRSPPLQPYYPPQRQPEKRKRRWDEPLPSAKRPTTESGHVLTPNSFHLQPARDASAPAMQPMARSGSSAPALTLPDWATISRIQSIAARASELWPPHQTSSSSVDSPIDFVLYKERLARREWTPQW